MGIETNTGGDPDFEAFANAGDVEVGDSDASTNETTDKKPAQRSGRPPREEKPAEKAPAGDDDGDEDETGEGDDGDEDETGDKPRKSAAQHQIERLKREKAELNRRLRSLEGGAGSAELRARLENIERGLSGGNSGDTKTSGKPAPDPTDTAKYPLGHLDDRYIEDKLDWLADQKAAEKADSVLQRQQENERNAAVLQQQAELLDKVDELAAKGSDLYPDFQEEVVETGMRGEWKLSQPTFEAAAEADNGAQILYELSQNKREAARVAALSPYQQLKFVQERDAEIRSGKKGRTKPQAGDPPQNLARGANSKTQISPATDNLNDFEKAWKQDEAKSKR